MSLNQRLWGWILIFIPLIGLLAYTLGSTSPAGMPTTNTGRTRAGPSRFAPPPQPSPSPTTTATPAHEGSSAPPAVTVSGPHGGQLDISELYALLDQQPLTVTQVTFVNGSSAALVYTSDGSTSPVTIPDSGVQPLVDRLLKAHVKFSALQAPADQWATFKLLGPILVPGLMFLGFVFLQRHRAVKAGAEGADGSAGGGAGGMGNLAGLGKSKSVKLKPLSAGEKKLTFDDIGGADEAVRHMKRIARWQKYRKIYTLFGAKPPKGFIIDGPPGVGKTYLVSILAHQTDADMHITSGSDFEEMLVGVGASRMRDTWDGAEKAYEETGRTQIIVIDEIDAVAGRRSGGMSGSNDQTLNAMLVLMDGVLKKPGIIVIGLTNRKDMLDPAVIRAGRLEYSLTMDNPDVAGRTKIGEIHSRDKKLAPNVTPAIVAEMMYGFSGAQIAMVFNHAAMLSAERLVEGDAFDEKAEAVQGALDLDDFIKSIDFIQFGDERTAKQAGMRDVDKLNTNVHELGGHALVADVLKKWTDGVSKVTIVRRARALGFVSFTPDHDRVSFTKEEAYAKIIVLMAGRAAQEHFLGVEDSGASMDFQMATDLIRQMITEWGLSKLGKISVGQRRDGKQVQIGPALLDKIDAEMQRISDECYDIAMQIVIAEEPRFMKLAPDLQKVETFQGHEWRELMAANPAIFDPRTLPMFNKQPKLLEL